MRKLLGLAIAVISAFLSLAASCGGGGGIPGPQPTPPPVPVPTPTPPPPPTPVPQAALKVQGGRLVKADGSDPKLLGSIIGCHLDGVSGWPLVCKESLVEIAKAGLNWTHVRTGPFTAEAEAPEFAFYEKGVGGRYDLTKVNQDFIGRLRTRIKDALDLGIYVEVDLPIDRWPIQHKVSPWQAENNLQGVEHGGLDIFQRAPDAVHEAAVLAIVMSTCEFPNVIYSLGNESFKSDSGAFSSRMVALIRQLCPLRPIGSNSAEGAALADYTILHQNSASQHVADGHPVEVNEFAEPGPTPQGVIAEAQKADAAGTYYHYWRGGHTQGQWLSTMVQLGKIRAGQPPPPPSEACLIPTTDVPQVSPRPAGGSTRDDLVDQAEAAVKAQHPELFAPDGTLAGWPSDGTLQASFASRYFTPLVEWFQARGDCASVWEDSIAVGHPSDSFYEEFHVLAFGPGRPIDGPHAYRFTWSWLRTPGPVPGPTPTPVPTPAPTPGPAACPISAPGSDWVANLKPNGGQLLDLTPYVGNSTHTANQPWVGCGVNRCPLSCEKGDVACACQKSLFGNPIFTTSGGSCTIIPQASSAFTVKVATGSCSLFAKGDVPGSAQLGPWEVSATVPACHVGSDGLCH